MPAGRELAAPHAVRRALLVGLSLSLASCQERERLQAPLPPPSAASTTAGVQEAVTLEAALYAVEGTGAELEAMMKGGGNGTAMPYVAVLGVDSHPLPDEPPPSEFERYFFIAREAALGVVGQEQLARPVSVLLVAGRNPPCFGTARRSAVVSALDSPKRSKALIVGDCPHPPNHYGALAIRGVAGASVTFLDEVQEPLQNQLSRQPGHEQINQVLQQLNDEAVRRASAAVEPLRRAAELLPELNGTHAEVQIVLGPDRYFIAYVKGSGGAVTSTKLVRVTPDGSAKVLQTLPM
jgi:hypothetical protein